MTRPTSLSREIPTLTHRLGSVFPAPASLSSNTVDRASGIDVFVPPTESNIAPILSNTGGANPGSQGTVSLGGTATTNSLLVFSVATRGSDGEPTTPTGWTKHPDGSVDSGSGNLTIMYYKTADGTETGVTFTPNGGGGWSGGISEWPSGLTLDGDTETTGTTNPLAGAAVTPTAGREALIIGAFGVVRPGDAATSATATGSWTELHDVMVPGGFSPLFWSAYQVVVDTSGAYTPAGTCNAAGLTYGAQTLAFSRSTNPVNGGPNATDGSASTYVSTGGTVDIDLGARYEIVRSNARLATASGGSRTFTIYGANVADFSDAVTLDTTTFTASGSFGAQDISFSWARGQSFRYYRLENTTETWRLHTWELYEPTVGDTHDHDYVPESTFDALGDLLVGTGSDTYARKGSVSSNVYSLQTRQDGDLEWGPFVRSIVSNGSNTLLRPDVNLVSGTGITFALTSNSITISATGSSGGSGSGAPTDAEYLVTAADGDLSAERVVDLGAYQLLTRRAAANAEDDHFNAASLDVKWLAYTGADLSSVDLATLPGWAILGSAGHKIQAVPAGDWTIEAEVLAPDITAAGFVGAQLILTDGTAAASATDVRYIFGPNNSLTVSRLNASRFVNNAFSAGLTDYTFTTPRDRMFIRIRKSGTTYAWDWSEGGKTWHQIGSTAALGFVPTHFGFGGTTGAYFNYFLRY